MLGRGLRDINESSLGADPAKGSSADQGTDVRDEAGERRGNTTKAADQRHERPVRVKNMRHGLLL